MSLNCKYDAEFREFYAPLTFIQVMKSRMVRRIGDLVVTAEGKRQKHRWMDYIEMNVNKIGLGVCGLDLTEVGVGTRGRLL